MSATGRSLVWLVLVGVMAAAAYGSTSPSAFDPESVCRKQPMGSAGCGWLSGGHLCFTEPKVHDVNHNGPFQLFDGQVFEACRSGPKVAFYLTLGKAECSTKVVGSQAEVAPSAPSGTAAEFTAGSFSCKSAGGSPPTWQAQSSGQATVNNVTVKNDTVTVTNQPTPGDPEWVISVTKKKTVVKVKLGCLAVSAGGRSEHACPKKQITVKAGRRPSKPVGIQLTNTDKQELAALKAPPFEFAKPSPAGPGALAQISASGKVIVGLDEGCSSPIGETDAFISKYLAALASLWHLKLELRKPLTGYADDRAELKDGSVELLVSTNPPSIGIPLVSSGACGSWQLYAADPKLEAALHLFSIQMIDSGKYASIYQSAFSKTVNYTTVDSVVFPPNRRVAVPGRIVKVPSGITIESSSLSPVEVGSDPYVPAAIASSGLPVATTLDSSSRGCSLVSGVVSFTGTGTCVIDFDQPGDAHWAAAAQKQQTIDVIEPGHLYWTSENSKTIASASISGSGHVGAAVPFVKAENYELGVAVDGGHVYWTDHEQGEIGRSGIDGTEVEGKFVAGPGLVNPIGVAVDGGHVYWADYKTNAIGRANLDGTAVDPSFITAASVTYGVAVYNGYIYWANSSADEIDGVSLTDPSRTIVKVVSGCQQPEGVVVNGQYMYWTNSADNTIGRADLNGASATNVDQSFAMSGGKPIGIAVAGDYVYWVDYAGGLAGAGTIERASASLGGSPQTVVGGLTQPYGLAAGP
jgi:hypothetical protein